MRLIEPKVLASGSVYKMMAQFPKAHSRTSCSHNLLTFLICFICVSTFASAARFPNAVEKKVVLIGSDAVAVARLLGLALDTKSSVQLPLARSDAWAIYLLKRDTLHPIFNADQEMPERYNTVEFTPSPVPQLSIGSYWLDQATALPHSESGVFSFNSPEISDGQASNSPWRTLLYALREKALAAKGTSPVVERRFYFNADTQLNIRLWVDQAGHSALQISVRYDSQIQ